MKCNVFSILIVSLFLVMTVAAAETDNSTIISAPGSAPAYSDPFKITLFIPSPNMIHSDQILDQVNIPDGGVLFGTSFGLSRYNGSWSTLHTNHDNISQGLMDEFITSVEYDHDGNLWIGYPGGIQIFNGVSYVTIRDQQLFKDPQIGDLQRWHEDMWVATGHAGIHRYRKGTWTWFQPMTKNGPGFYEVREMALDPASDSLFLVTADNGLWTIPSPDDPVVFSQIAQRGGSYGLLQQVRRDPLGGVYFFNDTAIVHYSRYAGFIPVLTVQDLTMAEIAINDLAAASDRKLYIATDKGIYIWKDSRVIKYLSRFEGIGTSEVVRTISLDAQNRVWFSTKEYVGYFHEQSDSQNPIPIAIITPVPENTPLPPTEQPTVLQTITVSPEAQRSGSFSGQDGLTPILDPILRALNTILEKLGISSGQFPVLPQK